MTLFNLAIITTALLLIISGIYMLMRTHSMLRIIIAIEILMKAITMVLAFAGYISGSYMLVQTFIITMIIIEVVIVMVACALVISYYRKNGNMDIRKLNKLKG